MIAAMVKRAVLVATGVLLVLLLSPVALGQLDTTGTALTPPAGEIAVLIGSVVGVTLLVTGVALWLHRRRAVRTAAPPRGRRSRPAG